MTRKKRTRKEKIIAELRRKSLLLNQPSQSSSVQNQQLVLEPQQITKIHQITTPYSKQLKKDYQFVLKDAKQTILITLSIITINLALYFSVQNKLISLTLFGLQN